MNWAIVPVKPLLLGKSRLASVVPPTSRAIINRIMLERTLTVLRSTEAIAEILVISRDPEVLAIAREFQAKTLLEQSGSQLNPALERATAVVASYKPKGLLIIPADLPLLEVDDVLSIIFAVDSSPAVVLAPDRHEQGTNALFAIPPGKIPYLFGPNSFYEHRRVAQERGIDPIVVRRQALELDLDLPEDLELLRLLHRTDHKPLLDAISAQLPVVSSPEEAR